MSTTIRTMEESDLPLVANLFADTFRQGRKVDINRLIAYLDQVYFKNPWFDNEIASLVCERQSSGVVGFIGVIPRLMRLGKRQLRVAVGSNLMFRSDQKLGPDPFAPAALLRHLLQGKQDLTVADTANEPARKLWELLGGQTSRLYGLSWIRPLRPCALGLDLIPRTSPLAKLKPVLRPVMMLADGLVRHWRGFPFEIGKNDALIETLSSQDLLNMLAGKSSFKLVPSYDEASLNWLLSRAAEKNSLGPLRQIAVRRKDGGLLGSVVYYRNPDGISHVLQLVASPHDVDALLSALFEDAQAAGSLALRGRLEPLYMREFSTRRCLIQTGRTGAWMLVHSKDPTLIAPFMTGHAFFSGLEGERWTRFVADDF